MNCLWKVDSSQSSFYLCGSIHFIPKEIYPLSDDINKAFDESDVLIVENNVLLCSNGHKNIYQEKGYYKDSSLKEELIDKIFELTEKIVRSLGLSIKSFLSYRPWYLAMTLQLLKCQQIGYSHEYGIDRHFLERAASKQIIELESSAEQIDIFCNLSSAEQQTFLLDTLVHLKKFDQTLVALVKAWKEGDTNTLSQLLDLKNDFPSMKSFYEALYEKICYGRNRAMVSKIVRQTEGGSRCFVVVGLMHLLGEKGIISLLQKQYHIKQL